MSFVYVTSPGTSAGAALIVTVADEPIATANNPRPSTNPVPTLIA